MKLKVLLPEDAATIEAVAGELFACGPRLTGDDRSRLAAKLRRALSNALEVGENDLDKHEVSVTNADDAAAALDYTPEEQQALEALAVLSGVQGARYSCRDARNDSVISALAEKVRANVDLAIEALVPRPRAPRTGTKG
jgi:hypothetical protein